MNKIHQTVIKELLSQEDNITLSLYLPTHRFPTSEHITEDKIRFKNLIKASKEKMQALAAHDGIAAVMIDQLETLYANDDFWQHTTEGLAVFCSPAGLHYFHLPIECDTYCSVSDRYDIAPLLAVASYDQPYYVLALAVKRPVLLRGDMYGLERVAIDLPASPGEALGIDELHSNSRTDRAGGHGAGAKAHGQGDSRQAGQEERLKYFRLIDEKLHTDKRIDQTLPILVAGTDDDVSGYKESSRSKQLLAASLSGNYTEAPLHDIHRRAWPLIMEAFDCEAQSNEIEQLSSLIGTGKASMDVPSIVAAAREGKVATFLIGMLTSTRDSISDSNRIITKLVFSDNYQKENVSACARAVFDQGGKIVGVLRSALPSGASEAAVYRY